MLLGYISHSVLISLDIDKPFFASIYFLGDSGQIMKRDLDIYLAVLGAHHTQQEMKLVMAVVVLPPSSQNHLYHKMRILIGHWNPITFRKACSKKSDFFS